MSSKPVTTQQPSLSSMDLYHDLHVHPNEKHAQYHQTVDNCEANSPCHKHCHQSRLRRLLFPAIALFLALAGLFALSCFSSHIDFASLLGYGAEGLAKRATGDTSSGNNTFIDRKYYLIVVFVGLVVVVILGICLAAWCCKGSFENPLCCPCYLCACCGGLACLECIGCGLCAEGIDQM